MRCAQPVATIQRRWAAQAEPLVDLDVALDCELSILAAGYG